MHNEFANQALDFHIGFQADSGAVVFEPAGVAKAFPAVVQLDEPRRSYDKGFAVVSTATLLFDATADPGLLRGSAIGIDGVTWHVDRIDTGNAGNVIAYVMRRPGERTTTDSGTNRGR